MNTIMTSASYKTWRQARIILPLLLASVLLLYADSVLSMVNIWMRSDTYTHGIVILPISIYLIWLKRKQLSAVPLMPNRLILISIIMLSIIWLVAAVMNIVVLEHFSLVLILIASIICFVGIDLAKIIIFPLFYLIFMVPVGEGFIEPLQDFTARFVVLALQITGIPVLLEGRFFSIPSGDFEVAKACSGIRYLMVTISLGTIYAYMMYRSVTKRLLFVGLSILIPIIANGIRAYGIVMLAHLSDMQLAVGVDHVVYGWIFFGIVLFTLFWVGSFWTDKTTSKGDIKSNYVSDKTLVHSKLASTAILIFIFSATGPAVYAWTKSTKIIRQEVAIKLPVNKDGWLNITDIDTQWGPEFKSADETVLKKYQKEQSVVYLYVALYTNEIQGKELINSENAIYNSIEWKRLSGKTIKINISEQDTLSINETIVQSKKTNMIVWYWYDISGYKTSNEYLAKLYQVWVKLKGSDLNSTVIAVATSYDDVSEAERVLKRYLVNTWPIVTLKSVFSGK